MYAPQAAFFCELSGTAVRYSGASVGYQLAAPLAGGIASLVSPALLKSCDNQPWSVAVCLILQAIVTLASVWLAAETHYTDLHG